jgi:hypothetical protein
MAVRRFSWPARTPAIDLYDRRGPTSAFSPQVCGGPGAGRTPRFPLSLEPTVAFADYEVPVAYSMVKMATRFKGDVHPLGVFTCYWAAFNNIYVTIADQQGRRPQLRTHRTCAAHWLSPFVAHAAG